MLKLEGAQFAAMRAHATAGYPNEICGIMLGEVEKGENPETSVRIVREVMPAGNLNKERASDRYDLDPKDQIKAEKRARQMGWQVLGFYHSHPDHPCKASVTDYERSWEAYSYLIISVQNGEPADQACWIRNPAVREDYFVEENVEILRMEK